MVVVVWTRSRGWRWGEYDLLANSISVSISLDFTAMCDSPTRPPHQKNPP